MPRFSGAGLRLSHDVFTLKQKRYQGLLHWSQRWRQIVQPSGRIHLSLVRQISKYRCSNSMATYLKKICMHIVKAQLTSKRTS